MHSFVRKMLPIFPDDRPNGVVSVMSVCVCGSVDTQSYQLNFHGRVTQASVKNFQIVHDVDGTCVRFFSLSTNVCQNSEEQSTSVYNVNKAVFLEVS